MLFVSVVIIASTTCFLLKPVIIFFNVLLPCPFSQRLRNYNIEVNDLSQELRSVLSDSHFETIERITNKSKEKQYVKKRNHLIEKYQSLTKGNNKKMTGNKLYLNLLF